MISKDELLRLVPGTRIEIVRRCRSRTGRIRTVEETYNAKVSWTCEDSRGCVEIAYCDVHDARGRRVSTFGHCTVPSMVIPGNEYGVIDVRVVHANCDSGCETCEAERKHAMHAQAAVTVRP